VRTPAARAAALLAVVLLVVPVLGDEGMWTFDNPPAKLLKERYGFELTRPWLDHLRLASVRFMDGGSGSFVSPDGLMITNHHVGLGCIENVSSAGKDYVKAGFYAPARSEEAACPGYEVNVLVAMEDVTTRVLARSSRRCPTPRRARPARRRTAAIENECSGRTKLRCNVESFYQGGEYQLYQYRKYTDVRLVFAPEQSMAFFGGDPDNFTFPRHDVDICLMRAYENGRPVKPESYLRWSPTGVADGDLVFVSGHPGSTSRLETTAAWSTCAIRRGLSAWSCSSAGSPPCARTRRSATSRSAGRSPDLRIRELAEGRRRLLRRAPRRKGDGGEGRRGEGPAREGGGRPGLAKSIGDPWATVAGIQQKVAPPRDGRAARRLRRSQLLAIAGQIVQYVAEVKKPNGKRYGEFVDANLDSLRTSWCRCADLRGVRGGHAGRSVPARLDKLGPGHAFVRAVLAGKTPAEAAKAAVGGTALADVSARKALLDGGETAVAAPPTR